jgi:leucyl aminopeptidase
MQIRFADNRPTGDYALVMPVAGKDRSGLARLGTSQQSVGAALDRSRFEGEGSSASEQFIDDNGTVRRLLVVGTGAGSAPADGAEKLGGMAAGRLQTSGEKTAVIDLTGLNYDADAAAKVALGATLRSWRYDRYRTRLKDNQKATLDEVVVVGGGSGADKRYEQRWAPVVQGVSLTRELVTEPANIIYPESFVERVKASIEGTGIEIEVLDRAAMEKLGMGALLGVAQGSSRDGRFLILKWNGGGKGQPTAFVGKGVTFDTGGISIKPGAGMEDMKGDMAGAACVVGLMHALAARKAKANVIGAIGLVENMPDGNAQRPGDIVTALSGTTIEIINTDAEGRLVLADLLWYLQSTYQPSLMVDLATLTGAIIVALAHEYAGLFSNSDELSQKLHHAGLATGEKVWRLPLGPSYDKLIESKFADIKNTGGRHGGSITAAQFLQRFVNDVPWAHLDIAGTGMGSPADEINQSWGSGWGVRLLNQFVAENHE